MKYLKGALLFLITFFFLIVAPSVQALDHTIRGGILIPNDWKDRVNQRQLEEYKQGIVHAMQTAQYFYSKNLNGKTFKYDGNVAVQTSYKNIGESDSQTFSGAFYYLEGDTLFPTTPGTIWLIWTVGSTPGQYTGASGESNGADAGTANFSFNDLLALSRNADSDWELQKKHVAEALVIHELAHTLDLLHAGYAYAHPCTDISTHECMPGAPRPLPPAEEWNYSILGYGGIDRTFNTASIDSINIGFNNSVHNPEKWKLFKSPFINPGGEEAPEPVTKKQPEVIEATLTYNTSVLKPKDTLIIKGGAAFGKFEGEIAFVMPGSYTEGYRIALEPEHYVITSWNDKEVQVVFRDSAESPSTQRKWLVELKTADGNEIRSTNTVTVRGEQMERDPLTAYSMFKVTCGPSKVAFPNIPVRLLSETGEELAAAVTDIKGWGDITYAETSYKDVYKYKLAVGTIGGVGTSEPESYDLELSPSTPMPYQAFHFANCTPDIVVPTANPDKPTLETVYIEGKVTNLGVFNLENLVLDSEIGFKPGELFFGAKISHGIGSDGYYWMRIENLPTTDDGNYFCRIIARSPSTGEYFKTEEFLCKSTQIINYFDFSIFYGDATQKPFEGNPDFTPTPVPKDRFDRSVTFKVHGKVTNRKSGNVSDLKIGVRISPATSYGSEEVGQVAEDGTFTAYYHVTDARYISHDVHCEMEISLSDDYTKGLESFPCNYSTDYERNIVVDYEPPNITGYYFADSVPPLDEGISSPPPLEPIEYNPENDQTPNIEAPKPEDIQTPSPAEITSIVVSNYSDFRLFNTNGDEGDETQEFAIRDDHYYDLEWKLSTLTSWQGIYVKEQYSDGATNVYSASLGNDQEIRLHKTLKMLGKFIKKIASVQINGEYVDFSSGGEVSINLVGQQGTAQDFTVPIVITYTDGEVIYDALQVNYRPEVSYETPPNDTPTDNISSPETTTPETYPEETLPNIASCPAPYPQCGGTAGLEDLSPENTYLISVYCDDSGNVLGYNPPEYLNSSCGQ